MIKRQTYYYVTTGLRHGRRARNDRNWRKVGERKRRANKNVGVLHKLNFYGMRAKHDPLFCFIHRRSVV